MELEIPTWWPHPASATAVISRFINIRYLQCASIVGRWLYQGAIISDHHENIWRLSSVWSFDGNFWFRKFFAGDFSRDSIGETVIFPTSTTTRFISSQNYVRHTAKKQRIWVPHHFTAFISDFLPFLWVYMGSMITQGYDLTLVAIKLATD